MQRGFESREDFGTPGSIGPYRILDVLGEGAMGTVFLAEQKEPVRRRVALKVIKLGMDSRAVLARFELERQALAVMNHEAIAKVFEAGTTERGQPYFVMELVEGVPVTVYCDEHRLPMNERVRLFQSVCAGVQHAHQKGVLHRDLKPGNVLITRQGEGHVPKIIDFGVARATDHQLLQDTMYTEQGAIVGTPEYMSPEQASGTALDIDTRTDIYSLGVLLYELLTGDLPFPRGEFRRAGIVGMQQILREKDPPKPSTKVSSSGALARDHAQRRRTSASGLAKELRGDLDWIVMKAMAKEPERRYSSAAEFSRDLENYLLGQPVVARPPSASYLLSKLVRRHKVEVAAGALLFLVSGAGFAVSAAFAIQAREAAADYQSLLIGAEMDALEFRAKEAYPPWPAMAAELAAIASETERLVATIADQRKVVEKLRAGHILAAATERSAARGPHFDEARQARIEGEIALLERDLREAEASPAARAEGQREIEALEQELQDSIAAIEESNRVQIDDVAGQFFHDRLELQIRRLLLLERELLPDLRFRADWASRVAKESIEDHQQEWDEAIEAIRSSPRYRGLELEPQLGLVPLGADPVSRLWEFGHLPSGELPARVSGKLELQPEHGIVFVLVPPGEFRFGYVDVMTEEQASRFSSLEFVEPFFLAKYEMSRLQWQRLARGQHGLRLMDGGILDLRNRYDEPEKPANGVTALMCEELLAQNGLRLPSEVEWEYACKAGSSSWWSTGAHVQSLAGFANLRDQTYLRARGGQGAAPIEDGLVGLAPAIAMKANGFGLHQMHGNVFEWCGTALGRRDRKRAARGGSWMSNEEWAQSIRRNITIASDASRDMGLRPARRIYRGPVEDMR